MALRGNPSNGTGDRRLLEFSLGSCGLQRHHHHSRIVYMDKAVFKLSPTPG